MNKQHHIEELEKKIEHIETEGGKTWFGRVSKSVKVRRIQKKINSLRKELEK